jgi:ABC-type multidrug transport system ATPase subunit
VYKFILESRSLVKRVAGASVLDGIHLQIQEKESVAFLASEESGKSTLIEVLSTIEPPSAGDLFITGLNTKFDLKRVKNAIAVVNTYFDEELSVFQNLHYHAKFFFLPPVDMQERLTHLVRLLDIDEVLDSNPADLNHYEKLRVGMARALFTFPKILFVDEPTRNLNQKQKEFIRQVLQEIRSELSVIFTTSDAIEAQNLADKVGILTGGKMKDFGEPKQLIRTIVGHEVVEFVYKEEEVDYFISRIEKTYQHFLQNEKIYIFLKEGQDSKKLLDMINSDEVILRKPDLKDLLIKHTSTTERAR